MLSTICCTQAFSQEPKLFSDNKVEFTTRAPEAQKVQVDICGTKYDMTKGDNGIWKVTTNPLVPGFHYYSLIIDGVSVADPASQSFYIGLRDPEVFANVGVFSTGMFGGIRGASNFDLEKEVPGMLTDTKTFNKQFDVFFVSCGEQDPRIEYTRNIVKTMRDGGVEVKFNSYPGDHEWQVWRKSLHEFAQYLFKE